MKSLGFSEKGCFSADDADTAALLLFEHKQYLQSYDAGRSMQTEISSFKIMAV